MKYDFFYPNELVNLPNKLSERENSSVAGKWECSMRFILDPIQAFLFANALLPWVSSKEKSRRQIK